MKQYFPKFVFKYQLSLNTVNLQKWSWNKTWIRACDLDRKTTSHGYQGRITKRYLGRNVRETVVLALYRPTSTSNINSLKEYESYAKMNLEQDLSSNLWPEKPRAMATKGILDTKVLGRNIRKMVVLALYRPTSTSNINSLKEYESYAKMKFEQDLSSNLWPGPKKPQAMTTKGVLDTKYLGRNIRKVVVLALYGPTSTSNINSLKEYESYAKMKLEQDLSLNLWPGPDKPRAMATKGVLDTKVSWTQYKKDGCSCAI